MKNRTFSGIINRFEFERHETGARENVYIFQRIYVEKRMVESDNMCTVSKCDSRSLQQHSRFIDVFASGCSIRRRQFFPSSSSLSSSVSPECRRLRLFTFLWRPKEENE